MCVRVCFLLSTSNFYPDDNAIRWLHCWGVDQKYAFFLLGGIRFELSLSSWQGKGQDVVSATLKHKLKHISQWGFKKHNHYKTQNKE